MANEKRVTFRLTSSQIEMLGRTIQIAQNFYFQRRKDHEYYGFGVPSLEDLSDATRMAKYFFTLTDKDSSRQQDLIHRLLMRGELEEKERERRFS